MRLKWLGDRLASELAGMLIGRQFARHLRELERAQWLSPEELRVRSDERLERLLRHAADNVPFYRDAYRQLGLSPNDLRHLDDLTQLPIVSKLDHCQHPLSHFLADNLPAHQHIPEATSGSTGEPFEFYLDREAVPIHMANHAFSDAWYGLGPFSRSVRVRAPRVEPPKIAKNEPVLVKIRKIITGRLRSLYEGWTQEQISAWEVGSAWAESTYRRMEAHHPDFITGYTSGVAGIADELLRRNLRLSRRVRGVITEGEPLTPSRRKLIEDYFEAPIGNRLGIRELGAYVAQSCPEAPDQFHVISDHVIAEIVLENGTRARPGERGRLILTDLHNYVMPFIRYDSGDLAIAGDAPCLCGRGFPIITQIEGRSHECLRTPAGKVISPAALGQYLGLYHDYRTVVRHYQLVEEREGHVRLLVVPAPQFDSETQKRMQRDLMILLGEDMSAIVEVVPEIPCEKSGKRPIIKLAKVSGA